MEKVIRDCEVSFIVELVIELSGDIRFGKKNWSESSASRVGSIDRTPLIFHSSMSIRSMLGMRPRIRRKSRSSA